MKKIIISLILASLLVMPIVGFTAEITGPPEEPAFNDIEGLLGIMETIGNWIFSALLILAGIFLVWAGFLFVTAGGDPQKPVQARQMLINALIGVAIALGSKGLISVITNLIQN